jgi:hypothetical protein
VTSPYPGGGAPLSARIRDAAGWPCPATVRRLAGHGPFNLRKVVTTPRDLFVTDRAFIHPRSARCNRSKRRAAGRSAIRLAGRCRRAESTQALAEPRPADGYLRESVWRVPAAQHLAPGAIRHLPTTCIQGTTSAPRHLSGDGALAGVYRSMRREVHKRACPDCDGTLRIPIVYPHDTDLVEDERFEVGKGARCSNQANGHHRVIPDDEFKQLVRQPQALPGSAP